MRSLNEVSTWNHLIMLAAAKEGRAALRTSMILRCETRIVSTKPSVATKKTVVTRGGRVVRLSGSSQN
jgi:hypothetical protein